MICWPHIPLRWSFNPLPSLGGRFPLYYLTSLFIILYSIVFLSCVYWHCFSYLVVNVLLHLFVYAVSIPTGTCGSFIQSHSLFTYTLCCWYLAECGEWGLKRSPSGGVTADTLTYLHNKQQLSRIKTQTSVSQYMNKLNANSNTCTVFIPRSDHHVSTSLKWEFWQDSVPWA